MLDGRSVTVQLLQLKLNYDCFFFAEPPPRSDHEAREHEKNGFRCGTTKDGNALVHELTRFPFSHEIKDRSVPAAGAADFGQRPASAASAASADLWNGIPFELAKSVAKHLMA